MDFPRLPPSYKYDSARCLRQNRHIPSLSEPHVLAAVTIVLASHAGSSEVVVVLYPEGRCARLNYDPLMTLESLVMSDLIFDDGVTKSDHFKHVAFDIGSQCTDLPEHPILVRTYGDEIFLWHDTAVLSYTEASWFLDHCQCLFNAILSPYSPSSNLQGLSARMISEDEKNNILTFSRPSSTHCDPFPEATTLHGMISEAVSIYTSHDAISFYDPQTSKTLDISFMQFIILARILTLHLPQRNSKSQSSPFRTVIPLCLSKSPSMIISMLSVLISGHGYCNIEPSLPHARRLQMIDKLPQPPLILTSEPQFNDGSSKYATLDPSEILEPYLEKIRQNGKSFTIEDLLDKEPPNVHPADVAYVQFTSGSTGAPKGTVISHDNVVSFLKNYHYNFGRRAGQSRVFQFSSYGFDVMVMNIWDTLANGATVAMTTQSHLYSDLAQSVLDTRATNVDLTPTVSEILLEASEPLRSAEKYMKDWPIRHLSTGAEPVGRSIRQRWLARGVEIVQDYGPTETTVGVISTPMKETSSHLVPIGRPIGSNRVYLLHQSPSIDLVPLGCPGEICIGGPQVSPGYLDSKLNEDVFVESEKYGRIYRTGDLGAWVQDPIDSSSVTLLCFGRKDNQVKINGLRIEMGEVEQHFTPRLNDHIVKGVVEKFERKGTLPTGLLCFLELSPTSPLRSSQSVSSNGHAKTPQIKDSDRIPEVLTPPSDEFAEFIAYLTQILKEKLPSYMIPRYLLPISHTPTLASGKVDRKLLQSLISNPDPHVTAMMQTFQSHQGRTKISNGTTSLKASSQAREALFESWSYVLGVSRELIDDESEFPRLGGDSVSFMRVVSRLRRQGYPNITNHELANAQNLSECAIILDARSVSKESDKIDGQTNLYQPFSLLCSEEHLNEVLNDIQEGTSLQRSHIEDLLHTSPAQDSLLAGSLSSRRTYYSQGVYRIHPSIQNISRLRQSINKLIERHSCFRTAFFISAKDRKNLQLVIKPNASSASPTCPIQSPECKVMVVDDVDVALEKYLAEDRATMEFEWGRIHVRFQIISSSKKSDSIINYLVWSMHHAQSDGWTLDLLQDDLAGIYYGRELPERPNFGNVVKWWENSMENFPQQRQDAFEFWRDYIIPEQGVCINRNITDDHYDKESSMYKIENKEEKVTTEFSEVIWKGRLKKFCAKWSLTPAIVTRVAVGMALTSEKGKYWLEGNNYSGQESASACIKNPMVGVVRSGRDLGDGGELIDAEDIVGPCVSVLPNKLVPSNATRTTNVLDLIQAEAKSDVHVRQHQCVTLSDLVKISTKDTRRDLFDILVTYQNFTSRQTFDGDEVKPIREPPMKVIMPTPYHLSIEITPLTLTPLNLENISDDDDNKNIDVVGLQAYFPKQENSVIKSQELLREVSRILDVIFECRDPTRLLLGDLVQLDFGCEFSQEISISRKAFEFGNGGDDESSRPSTSSENSEEELNAKVLYDVKDCWSITFGGIEYGKLSSTTHQQSDSMKALFNNLNKIKLSFTEMGGDSIIMMRLSAQLRKKGFQLQIQDLRSLKNIKEQTKFIQDKSSYVP